MENVIPFDEETNPDEQIIKTVIHAIQTLREEENNLRIVAEKETGQSQIELFELVDSTGALRTKMERKLAERKRVG